MIRNKNPPTARIHSKIIIAEIIMRFFKDFLLAAFPLLVLQNCIIEITSVNTAMAGSAKSINSIFSPQFSASFRISNSRHHTASKFPKRHKSYPMPFRDNSAIYFRTTRQNFFFPAFTTNSPSLSASEVLKTAFTSVTAFPLTLAPPC